MSPISFPFAGERLRAFENIHSRLLHTHSAYWDAIYSHALDALMNEKWQPTGPAEKVVRSAITNAKKTVSRRASKIVAWKDAAEQVQAADTTSHSVASLEVFYLLSQAPR